MTKIIKKQKNENEEYERLKKKIKDCKPEEYEETVKEICEKFNH